MWLATQLHDIERSLKSRIKKKSIESSREIAIVCVIVYFPHNLAKINDASVDMTDNPLFVKYENSNYYLICLTMIIIICVNLYTKMFTENLKRI